jgi:hypothetical protein
MPRRAQLVCQQLEKISREALEKYQAIIRNYTRKRNGVYALYKGDRLYYVGLAIDLRRRLKQHLKDKHVDAWDRFSIYITIGDHHIKEMESLLLRITRPSGNSQIGKFARCENLARRFRRDMKTLQKEEITSIFGMKRKSVLDDTADRPVLAPYVHEIRRRRLRGRYKGKLYKARVRSDGAISIYGVKQRFNSPSLAAIHFVKRNMNGWWFWTYERSPGEWVRLKHLRD